MVTFFQAVFGGLAQGCVYALIALGYSVIYSTLKMGHFAQGEFYMVGAFVGLTLFTRMKLPVVIAFAGAALFTSILMLVLERLAYRPLYNRPSMSLLMATLGMQYVVQEIVRDIWGSDVVRSDNIFPQKNFLIGRSGDHGTEPSDHSDLCSPYDRTDRFYEVQQNRPRDDCGQHEP